MKRPTHISLSPNTQPDDIRRAWGALTQPRIWSDKEIVSSVERQVSAHLDQIPAVATSSGRSALYSLLKAANIGSGDEVIVQAFTCIAVPEPVFWVGARPVYADIDVNTYNATAQEIEKHISNKTKAVIVQHTFGIPANLEAIKQVTDKHNMLLIEDCAHAFGATYHGRPVGTVGDAAIVSFGRDKTISSVFGGAVVSRNKDLLEKVRSYQETLPLPPKSWIIQQLLHPILLDAILPVYFVAGLGKVWLITLQKLGVLSKAVRPEEREGKKPAFVNYAYSPALAYVISNQLDKLSAYTDRRRQIATRYMTALAHTQFELPEVPENTEPNWLRFPVRHPDAKTIIQQAKKKNIVLGDWYDAPLVPKNSKITTFQYETGSARNAETAGNQIINLPTYPLITDQQVEEVITFLQSYGS